MAEGRVPATEWAAPGSGRWHFLRRSRTGRRPQGSRPPRLASWGATPPSVSGGPPSPTAPAPKPTCAAPSRVRAAARRRPRGRPPPPGWPPLLCCPCPSAPGASPGHVECPPVLGLSPGPGQHMSLPLGSAAGRLVGSQNRSLDGGAVAKCSLWVDPCPQPRTEACTRRWETAPRRQAATAVCVLSPGPLPRATAPTGGPDLHTLPAHPGGVRTPNRSRPAPGKQTRAQGPRPRASQQPVGRHRGGWGWGCTNLGGPQTQGED